jgi:hypothetical protein
LDGCPTKTRPETVAVLVLVVEFDEMPESAHLEALVDMSREQGGPVRADFYNLAPAKTSLL